MRFRKYLYSKLIKLANITYPLKTRMRDKFNEYYKKYRKEIRLCYDNCNFLRPNEVNQFSAEPHKCKAYGEYLKHHIYHPHLVACEKCKVFSVVKEFYYK